MCFVMFILLDDSAGAYYHYPDVYDLSTWSYGVALSMRYTDVNVLQITVDDVTLTLALSPNGSFELYCFECCVLW